MSFANDDLLIRYLLGESSVSEKEEVERRLVIESGFAEQLDSMEDELIRDSLRGELTTAQQSHFEQNLLDLPEARQKYEMLRELIHAGRGAEVVAGPVPIGTGERANRRRYSVPKMLAAAVVVVAAVLGGEQLGVRRGRHAPVTGSVPPVASFVLAPGGTRGDSNGPKRLLVPAGTELVRIDLDVQNPSAYDLFEAVIFAVDGEAQVWGQGKLHAVGARPNQRVSIEVPAKALGPGDYTLRVFGAGTGAPELVEAYSFGVVQPVSRARP